MCALFQQEGSEIRTSGPYSNMNFPKCWNNAPMYDSVIPSCWGGVPMYGLPAVRAACFAGGVRAEVLEEHSVRALFQGARWGF